jgi:glycosyltransferase involved in cell wall biosynthesis
LQVAKYFKYLSRYKDLSFEVVTSKIPTLNMNVDESLNSYAEGASNYIHIPIFENRYVNLFLSITGLYKYLLPDFKFTFHLQSKRVIKLIKARPDVIYSRSFPISSTLMGYKLSKALKVPWILHLSDPWADCMIDKKTGLQLLLHRRLEKKCFTQATIISFTTDKTLCHYLRLYPEFSNKFRIYPNTFDPGCTKNDIEENLTTKYSKFRIVYTGVFRGEIGPHYILDPLVEIFRNEPALIDKVEIIMAGNFDRHNKTLIKKYQLPNFKHLGKIDYKESIELQRSADLLVVIDEPMKVEGTSIIYPSKMLDYMSTGNSILGIADKGTTTYELLDKVGGDIFSHANKKGVYNYLLKEIRSKVSGSMKPKLKITPPIDYNASFCAERLREEFLQLSLLPNK